MNLIALPKYGRTGASSRLRTYQYLEYLPELAAKVSPLFTDAYVRALYSRSRARFVHVVLGYLRRAAMLLRSSSKDTLLLVEKELFPWLPWSLEKWFFKRRPFIVDIDDAVFHVYEVGPVRRLFLSGKHDHLFRAAQCVIAGNEYLAARARLAGANRVILIPTVVRFARYYRDTDREARKAPIIVWIGSPSTQKYLELLFPSLDHLHRDHSFRLRAIGCDPRVLESRPYLDHVRWSEDTEVQALATADIGIMPLVDGPFERGKCGYKLVQYMASGLPVVASPVGVNKDIVRPGWNGFLCETSEQWEEVLSRLISDAALRQKMGRNGAALARSHFSIEETASQYKGVIAAALPHPLQ